MSTYGLFTMSNDYLCRTQFYSESAQHSIFHYIASGSYLTTNRDIQNYHIRCVRDVPVSGPDASFSNGGTLVE